MLLKTVFVRFYKSFNDDFRRRLDVRSKPKPWENIDDNWYPYIRVPIDRKITTIVGANESGKSHLLSAIKKATTGDNIERDDFCRYSKFFTVKKGKLKYPDFGTEWVNLTSQESDFFQQAFEVPHHQRIDSILLFRNNRDNLKLYIQDETGSHAEYRVTEKYVDKVSEILPRVFTIDSDIALPDSVPIRKLIESESDNREWGLIELLDYKQKNDLTGLLDRLTKTPPPQRNNNLNNSEEYDELVSKIVASLKKPVMSSDVSQKKEKETELAKKLIYKIADIDQEVLIRLSEALKDGKQGYANGIVKMINEQLANRLNFPNWWVQDKNFQLKIVARDHELVFTITDRTGTEYSFKERSSGLKYFLSYYIQYRSHIPSDNKNEILLMDEPDTYLSSRAQQDLLRIFEAFAEPRQDSHLIRPVQVVYVTHSPFLIDKNHSERIRVLRKGNDDEGTLVVRSVARNHYEPLRSAFGAFVGETTFIGNCNLMVEGVSDQILLAGAASILTYAGTSKIECLDLNNTTIVPAGSASHIPYLVHLAVGRDKEKPVVVVLFDSDKAGEKGKSDILGKGRQYGKPLLRDEYILQVGDISDATYLRADSKEKEIEDLIPLPICLASIQHYMGEIDFSSEIDIAGKKAEKEIGALLKENDIYKSVEIYIKNTFDLEIRIDKVGFARNISKILTEHKRKIGNSTVRDEDVDLFEGNFRKLFHQLNSMMNRAKQRSEKAQLSEKIARVKKRFLHKHPAIAMREDAIYLLTDIGNILEDNQDREAFFEIEKIKKVIQNLKDTFKLDIKYDVQKHIDDYQGFLNGLNAIQYAGDLASQEDEAIYGMYDYETSGHVSSQKEKSKEAIPKQVKGKNTTAKNNTTLVKK